MDRLFLRLAAGIFAGSLMLGGCAADAFDATGDKDETGASSGGKEDRWNYANDPSRFGGELDYTLAGLPRSGRSTHVSWPSSYWPTYENSINVRWRAGSDRVASGPDELSPAEKYDLVFNGWTPSESFYQLRPFECGNEWDQSYYTQLGPLARHISEYMGNKKARDGVDSDGDGQVDECGDNDGVETWWGLCHAWVPAALLEDRPERPVTYNGVTFYPGDLEALIIAAYNRAPAAMIGDRCNDGHGITDRPGAEVERDEQGRAVDVECRDTNAGSWHVIVTNYIGRQQRPIAEDRTYDYQVWNQPLVAYEITKMEEIDVARAHQLLNTTGDTYAYNPDAVKLFEVHANSTYITESHPSETPVDPRRYERKDYYTYILEVDAAGKIIGGEWFGSSRSNMPDFLWLPRRLSRSSVSNLDLEKVRMLIAMSREPVVPPPTGAREFAGQGGVAIPDNNPTGATSVANVPESIRIAGLQVELDIEHTYVGDLRVVLSHDGVERVLFNNEGGSRDDIKTTVTVAGFEGRDARGEWRLHVVDSAGADVGTIVAWKLKVVPESGTGGGGTGGGTTGTVTIAGQGGIAIPDNDAAGIAATATVPAGTRATSAQVVLNITHPYVGDLIVKLERGTQSWTLHNQTGGSADNIVKTVTLSPAPTGDVSGTWTLRVYDRAAADVGTLNSWSLVLTN